MQKPAIKAVVKPPRGLSENEKERIVVEIESRFAEQPDCLLDGPGFCMQYTHYTMEILLQHGLCPAIQAGTLCWPRIDLADDDGVSSTHFGYVWSPGNPISQMFAAQGLLPEIHTWVGLPDTQEVVDLSVKHLPEACRKASGLIWTGSNPPSYLWSNEKPPGVVYELDKDATLFACAKLWQLYAPEYLSSFPRLWEKVSKKWKL